MLQSASLLAAAATLRLPCSILSPLLRTLQHTRGLASAVQPLCSQQQGMQGQIFHNSRQLQQQTFADHAGCFSSWRGVHSTAGSAYSNNSSRYSSSSSSGSGSRSSRSSRQQGNHASSGKSSRSSRSRFLKQQTDASRWDKPGLQGNEQQQRPRLFDKPGLQRNQQQQQQRWQPRPRLFDMPGQQQHQQQQGQLSRPGWKQQHQQWQQLNQQQRQQLNQQQLNQQQQQQQQQQLVQGGPSLPGSFREMGVAPLLVSSLQKQRIVVPTPVQAAAMGPILSGRNVALQSSTGTGKTLAYLLPLLTRLSPWVPTDPKHKAARVLVIAPTQELCMQVLHTARELLPSHRKAVQPLVGGANPMKQLEAMIRHKPTLLCCTPGRLLKVFLRQGLFKKAFPFVGRIAYDGRVTWPGRDHKVVLVLEEADKLLAMQDMKDVISHLAPPIPVSRNDMLNNTPDTQDAQPPQPSAMARLLQSYQVLMVSASLRPDSLAAAPAWMASKPVMITTASPSTAVQAALRDRRGQQQLDSNKQQQQQLDNNQQQQNSNQQQQQLDSNQQEEQPQLVEMQVQGSWDMLDKADTADDGQQQQQLRKREQWASMLPANLQHQVLAYRSGLDRAVMRCLEAYRLQGKKVLLFVGQRQGVVLMHERLMMKDEGLQIFCVHNRMDPGKRVALIRGFNAGRMQALFVSDAYSLGLDFEGVDVVMAVESLPASVRQYVHRAGRTGRMGRPGTVLSLIPEQRVPALKNMLKRILVEPQDMALRVHDGVPVIEPKQSLETLLLDEEKQHSLHDIAYADEEETGRLQAACEGEESEESEASKEGN